MSYTRVKIVGDTINTAGVRNTSFEVYAPRYLLAEMNTHRLLARSAASSRAIPVETRIQMVVDEPFIPNAFGKNKKGMQSSEDLDEETSTLARAIWIKATQSAIQFAKQLKELAVHKQQANRILEPYVYYSGVVSGTEWDNFWDLRISEYADPGFYELACMMKEVYDAGTPIQNSFHLPYIDDNIMMLSDALKVSVARCARVSYSTFGGKKSSFEEDLELYHKLLSSRHLSPFDHPAISDFVKDGFWGAPKDHRHLYGWIPYRVGVEAANGIVCRRDSFAPVNI